MQNTLIIQAARFGDLVQTKRLILSEAALRNVHLCVDKSLGELARIIFPGAVVHELFFHSRPDVEKLRYNQKIFSDLAAIKFEKVFNCNFSDLTAAFCRLFDRDTVFGYRPLDHSEGGILRSPLSRLAFRLSGRRAIASLNLVDYWAWQEGSNPCDPAAVNPEARGGGQGIGVVIAGRESRRSLPPEQLAMVAQIVFNILQQPKIKLFGTKAEMRGAAALARHFSAPMQAKTVNLAGKTGWRELAEEMAGLDALITPDTGSMHLGAHLGVPVLAFFLSSAFCHETGPYGKGHAVWQAVSPCGPCLESGPCNHNLQCLNPFKDRAFLRALSVSFGKGEASPLPPNLQYWQTDFDALGQVLRLRGGEDRDQAARKTARWLTGRWLRLPNWPRPEGLAEADVQNLTEALFPESEWMLPRERYC